MPKLRQTCTRCSMRRQKCDRKSPCSRCIQNKEAHLCSREWPDGYNPNIHRKYPKRQVTETPQPEGTALPFSTWPQSTSSAGNSISPNTVQEPTHADVSRTNGMSEAQVPPLGDSSMVTDSSPESSQPQATPQSIEFLTWGKSELSDFNISRLVTTKDRYEREEIPNQDLPRPSSSSHFSPPARSVEAYHVQSLVPPRPHVLQLVEYHERCMGYYACILHGPSFRQSLFDAYRQSPNLQLQDLDYRWAALLFAIMAASILCSPESVSYTWGYTTADKSRLARQWTSATISCLLLGDFLAKPHLHSIQAIMTVHCVEHILGGTKEFLTLVGAAHNMARGLGIHRETPREGNRLDASSPAFTLAERDALVQRESGRRIWSSLCWQDWLSAPSTGMYTLSKKHFTTPLPGHYDDETMREVGFTKPAVTHFSNFLHKIASLMLEFFDGLLDTEGLEAKYDFILRYDSKMRALATKDNMPRFFCPEVPLDPSWPRWVFWSRRSFQQTTAHKIIMIHQSFLGKSFRNPQYAYSRWACTTSARQIIEHNDEEGYEDQPQWWVDQAFEVTSGIILVLDMFHRTDRDPQFIENKIWVERAIRHLESWTISGLASHGARLVSSLLNDRLSKCEPQQVPSSTNRSSDGFPHSDANVSNLVTQAMPCAVTGPSDSTIPPVTGPINYFAPQNAEMFDFEELLDTFGTEAGFNSTAFFDDILNFTHSELL